MRKYATYMSAFVSLVASNYGGHLLGAEAAGPGATFHTTRCMWNTLQKHVDEGAADTGPIGRGGCGYMSCFVRALCEHTADCYNHNAPWANITGAICLK